LKRNTSEFDGLKGTKIDTVPVRKNHRQIAVAVILLLLWNKTITAVPIQTWVLLGRATTV
jgi:hypothetical protein